MGGEAEWSGGGAEMGGDVGITFGAMDGGITTVLGSKLVVEYSVVDGIATEMQLQMQMAREMARNAVKDESFIGIFFFGGQCYY